MFAGVYHWFPKMYGRMMDEKLGKAHFAFSIIFITLVFGGQLVAGYSGHQRRLYDPYQYTFLEHLLPLVATGLVVALDGERSHRAHPPQMLAGVVEAARALVGLCGREDPLEGEDALAQREVSRHEQEEARALGVAWRVDLVAHLHVDDSGAL